MEFKEEALKQAVEESHSAREFLERMRMDENLLHLTQGGQGMKRRVRRRRWIIGRKTALELSCINANYFKQSVNVPVVGRSKPDKIFMYGCPGPLPH